MFLASAFASAFLRRRVMNLTLFTGQRPSDEYRSSVFVWICRILVRTLCHLELPSLTSAANVTLEASERNTLLVVRNVSEVVVRLREFEAWIHPINNPCPSTSIASATHQWEQRRLHACSWSECGDIHREHERLHKMNVRSSTINSNRVHWLFSGLMASAAAAYRTRVECYQDVIFARSISTHPSWSLEAFELTYSFRTLLSSWRRRGGLNLSSIAARNMPIEQHQVATPFWSANYLIMIASVYGCKN